MVWTSVPVLLLLLTVLFLLVHSNPSNISITTKKGPIIGLRFDPNPGSGVSYDAFISIPYGQIPARFQTAKPRSSWSQPLLTQTEGPMCPQPNQNFSEDCLTLNVITPLNASSKTGSLPVMVWIHGSRFTQSSSNALLYRPDFLVNESVIFVSMNYRVGALGFLTLGSRVAPGNMGLHDTLLALQWVQDEISTFGGDPSQVTLSGYSSGSVMTQMHYLSSLSSGSKYVEETADNKYREKVFIRQNNAVGLVGNILERALCLSMLKILEIMTLPNLFVRIIAQSGSVLADWGHYSAVEGARRAKVLAQAVRCDTTQNDSVILACLQSADINDIVGNQTADGILTFQNKVSGDNRVFLPVLDSYLTTDKPFFNDTLENLMTKALERPKPILTGFTAEEGILKLSESDNWKFAEDNLETFIPHRALGVLDSDERKTVANNIKRRYFPDTPDLNKVQSLVRLYTDSAMAYPSIQLTRYFANVTYGYLFAYLGPHFHTQWYFNKYMMSGTNHGTDIWYLFYISDRPQDNATFAANLPELNMKNQMVKWWTTFVKTGWQTVAEAGYLIIDSSLSTINSSVFESRYYSFWADIGNTTTNTAISFRLADISTCLILLPMISLCSQLF